MLLVRFATLLLLLVLATPAARAQDKNGTQTNCERGTCRQTACKTDVFGNTGTMAVAAGTLGALMATLDISKADPATKYYVQRTLLEFKLAGVDKDDATRARVQAINDDITKYASQFSRNLAESRLTVVVKDPKELDGLPEDFIKAHKPAADGSITLTSDTPDVTPVLKFSKSAELRKRIFVAYNNRAYPQNVAVLADLLKKRQELADVLGYQHWADVNAADKMAANSANISKFFTEIDAASKPAADREYKMLLASAQKQDPTLQQIGMQDRNYYFEQLRRSEFDFNSQAARPYFRAWMKWIPTTARFLYVC
jgi:thimet oligopeptidase